MSLAQPLLVDAELLLLLVNHFIAATWYLVGTVFEETHNWVDAPCLPCAGVWLDVKQWLLPACCTKEYKMRKDQAGLGYRYRSLLAQSPDRG